MKYLLKVNKKANTTNSVAIEVSSDLREFATLKDLIRHLFDNAMFIKSYEIFEVEEFEKSEEEWGASGSSQVNITTPTAKAIFN